MNRVLSLLVVGAAWLGVASAKQNVVQGKAFDRLITIWLENQVRLYVPRNPWGPVL
jgi:hypothetical protein